MYRTVKELNTNLDFLRQSFFNRIGSSFKGIHQESFNYVQNILRSHKNSFGLDDDADVENIFSFELEVILQNFFWIYKERVSECVWERGRERERDKGDHCRSP